MARYTKTYSAFVLRLAEVDSLKKFALAKERSDPIRLRYEINALCRGAIVLLSSHLEAYVKELGELALEAFYEKSVDRTVIPPRLFYHISRSFIDEVKDTSDPEKLALKVFEFLGSDIDYWSQSGTFPQSLPADRFNSDFANPAFKKVRSYFNRFGYNGYNNDLKKSLKADYNSVINMVDHLVETRNKIAHGDTDATKTPSEIDDMVSLIKKYCSTTDSLFASWCKSQFCPIR